MRNLRSRYEKNIRIKKIHTAVALTLLLLLYIVIFCFSAEDGEQSSAVSTRVTQALLRGYFGLTGESGTSLAKMVMLLEGLVRKMAHFLEYMCMGVLSYSIVVMWRDISGRGVLAVTVQVFVSASLDELHQYFIPGRYASPGDVLIDTAGGIAGILAILLWKKFFRKNHV